MFTNQEYLKYFQQSNYADIKKIYKYLSSDSVNVDIPVLICGKTGTGKEIVANLIKSKSNRSNKPFYTINCSQIPDNLFETEMFGYVKGAFTGAYDSKAGFFERAKDGFIYLDELDSLSMTQQVKLLRVLENKEFYRIGGAAVCSMRARIISSFGRSYAEVLSKNLIRQDLFYRLSGLYFYLPELKNRQNDIEWFINLFIKYYSNKYSKSIKFTPSIKNKIITTIWPGNIRELKSFFERIYLLEDTQTIVKTIDDYRTIIDKEPRLDNIFSSLKLKDVEQKIIERVLYNHQGNARQAAKTLGITSKTMYNKLKTYRKQGINI